jgi:hypothetical protein
MNPTQSDILGAFPIESVDQRKASPARSTPVHCFCVLVFLALVTSGGTAAADA